MLGYKKLKKIISIFAVIAFVFNIQSGILLHSHESDEWENQFYNLKKAYKEGKYTELKEENRIEWIINNNPGRKDLLGPCHLLLGAVFEKLEINQEAEENYKKAINDYNGEFIEGIDLESLPIYKKVKRQIKIENEFARAKQKYLRIPTNETNYRDVQKILEPLTRIYEQEIEDEKLVGAKVFLLLGAASENLKEIKKAKQYYKKARQILKSLQEPKPGDDSKIIVKVKIENPIQGIDFSGLKYYRKCFLKKCKFPVLLVVAGAAAVTVAIILLTKKKKIQEYTLTVNLGQGVEGTPPTGTNTYEEGTAVNYSYTLNPGYNNLVVQLDGTEVSSSGTITMNQNHTLTASANTNVVEFVTDQQSIEIPEGSNASFNIRLSAQPTADVNVTVARESGDTDISVISGSNLTFTTANWNIDQSVTLQAAQDTDTANGQANIAITAPDAAGITQKNITVTEQDDDVINDLTVRIVEPKNGTQVTRGTIVEIEAEASSSSGIEKVEFYVNNRLIKTDNKAPYKTSWDTTGELHGDYKIRAIAHDNNGNEEDSITVRVLPL